ncbi:MAG: endonuclease/exonuclease/phosphatase family protein, partial [Chthonomonadales bacterium]
VRDVERIGQYLLTLNADVICLQEVHECLPQSGVVDQPAILSHILGMTCEFSSGLLVHGGRYGIATFSKLPMRLVERVQLPNTTERLIGIVWRERRTALLVEVETQSGWITVGNTHWSLHSKDRLASADRLAKAMSGKNGILLGDFNTDASSAEVSRLMQGTGYVDLGAKTKVMTFPSNHPNRRIDLALATTELKHAELTVGETQLSDHLPLIVDW